MSTELDQHNDTKWSSCGYSDIDLKNKSFLDIGCWEGGFCVNALEAGAREVVGADYCTSPPLRQNLEKHNFKFYQVDVQSPKFLALGRYDIVSCSGVLYHLEDPINTLLKLRLMTKERLVLETSIAPIADQIAVAELSPKELISNWWTPNRKCLDQLLLITGFVPIQHNKWKP